MKKGSSPSGGTTPRRRGLEFLGIRGRTLFREYAFHLQVIGLLLLVGTVGVVVLSKREKEVAR